jgi:hypothetical protein
MGGGEELSSNQSVSIAEVSRFVDQLIAAKGSTTYGELAARLTVECQLLHVGSGFRGNVGQPSYYAVEAEEQETVIGGLATCYVELHVLQPSFVTQFWENFVSRRGTADGNQVLSAALHQLGNLRLLS